MKTILYLFSFSIASTLGFVLLFQFADVNFVASRQGSPCAAALGRTIRVIGEPPPLNTEPKPYIERQPTIKKSVSPDAPADLSDPEKAIEGRTHETPPTRDANWTPPPSFFCNDTAPSTNDPMSPPSDDEIQPTDLGDTATDWNDPNGSPPIP
jgi:hypothetical protein